MTRSASRTGCQPVGVTGSLPVTLLLLTLLALASCAGSPRTLCYGSNGSRTATPAAHPSLVKASTALAALCPSQGEGLAKVPYSAALSRQPLLIPIQHKGREKYQFIEQWPFTENGRKHIVPKGVVIDGASVPRLCWPWMPPDGLHRAGAAGHDWAYLNKGHIDGLSLSRAECDLIFYNLMVDAGVSPRRAGIAYRGVRLGGWAVWNRPQEPLVILPVDRRMMAPRVIEPRHLFSHIFAP